MILGQYQIQQMIELGIVSKDEIIRELIKKTDFNKANFLNNHVNSGVSSKVDIAKEKLQKDPADIDGLNKDQILNLLDEYRKDEKIKINILNEVPDDPEFQVRIINTLGNDWDFLVNYRFKNEQKRVTARRYEILQQSIFRKDDYLFRDINTLSPKAIKRVSDYYRTYDLNNLSVSVRSQYIRNRNNEQFQQSMNEFSDDLSDDSYEKNSDKKDSIELTDDDLPF